MKATKIERIRFPRMYQAFKNAREIGEVINRSNSYVHKAMTQGFTVREQKMIEAYTGRADLFEEGATWRRLG